jgi:hypothetical protein
MNAEQFYQSKNGGKSSDQSLDDGEMISPVWAVRAMNEYAKERTIDFAEWIFEYYSPTEGHIANGKFYTTAELYDIFNNENQEK